MKTNEAPEKIYLPNNPVLSISNLNERTSEDDIEYTRTDIFVEKACEWMKENADMFEAFDSYSKTYYMDKNAMIEEFKKAMRQ